MCSLFEPLDNALNTTQYRKYNLSAWKIISQYLIVQDMSILMLTSKIFYEVFEKSELMDVFKNLYISRYTPFKWNIKSLTLFNRNVNPFNFKKLSKYKQLEKLCFSTFSTKEVNLSNIQDCKSLTDLDIEFTPIKNFYYIEKLVNLKRINLFGTGLIVIPQLKFCTFLEDLNISKNNINDISPLKECINLKTLVLSYCKNIQNDNFNDNIKHLKQLTNLNISHTRLYNIIGLTDCLNIKIINLWMTIVRDLSSLENCIDLQVVKCSRICNINILTSKFDKIKIIY